MIPIIQARVFSMRFLSIIIYDYIAILDITFKKAQKATIYARFLMKICLQKCCQIWDQVCKLRSEFLDEVIQGVLGESVTVTLRHGDPIETGSAA